MSFESEIEALQNKRKKIQRENIIHDIALILSKYKFVFRRTQIEAFTESLENRQSLNGG
uniref:Uncharacterized protein n=1 Tax=viral metagenome TaxID=1070528 RepID=A0A6M3LMD0_9ZZZZ